MYPDEVRHEGEWADGVPHGEGIVTYPDGRRYEGAFRNGQPHGRGKWRRF